MQERLLKANYYEIGFNLGKSIINEGYTPLKLPKERLQLADGCKPYSGGQFNSNIF